MLSSAFFSSKSSSWAMAGETKPPASVLLKARSGRVCRGAACSPGVKIPAEQTAALASLSAEAALYETKSSSPFLGFSSFEGSISDIPRGSLLLRSSPFISISSASVVPEHEASAKSEVSFLSVTMRILPHPFT